jgi:hypothetical protein
MSANQSPNEARLIHLVSLECKDDAHATRCLEALATYGRPDALAFNCVSYDYGRKLGTSHICIVERWRRWEDLDALLTEKVVPALPLYNQLLARPFDPARDTTRIEIL